MMDSFSADEYAACFGGFFLEDCTVVSADRVAFVLRDMADNEEYSSLKEGFIRKRMAWCQAQASGGQRFVGFDIRRSQTMRVTTVQDSPGVARELFVNGHGLVTQATPDDGDMLLETRIPDALHRDPEGVFVLALKSIAEQAVVCGHWGLAARRIGPNRWVDLSLNPDRFPGPSPMLLDIDGFAADDLYAMSAESGVFHFNGEAWRRLPFPSNIPLESVCCGGNGTVYVGGKHGTIFAGRANHWERVHVGAFTLPFEDMIWHDNALWCTNDYGVWTFTNGTLARAPVPPEVYLCSGHLSAGQGTLLLGGLYGASLYDGSAWRVLYTQPEYVLQPDAFEE